MVCQQLKRRVTEKWNSSKEREELSPPIAFSHSLGIPNRTAHFQDCTHMSMDYIRIDVVLPTVHKAHHALCSRLWWQHYFTCASYALGRHT